eukprot:1498064-Rhodomonas_salina.1
MPDSLAPYRYLWYCAGVSAYGLPTDSLVLTGRMSIGGGGRVNTVQQPQVGPSSLRACYAMSGTASYSAWSVYNAPTRRLVPIGVRGCGIVVLRSRIVVQEAGYGGAEIGTEMGTVVLSLRHRTVLLPRYGTSLLSSYAWAMLCPVLNYCILLRVGFAMSAYGLSAYARATQCPVLA